MKTAATVQGFVLHIGKASSCTSPPNACTRRKANVYCLRKVSTCNGNNESTCDSQNMHTSVICL